MAFEQLKPGTLLCPVPAVMVSCASETEKPNVITIAWAGTVCSQPPMVSISVRKERHSHHIIKETGEFVINLVGRDQLKACDFCGVKSGRDVDKFSACHLTPVSVPEMQFTPAIGESPLYLACKVEHVLELGSHDAFVARIVGMGVSKDIMDATGKIDLRKADLTAYSHGVYYALGDAMGFFGYSVASPEVLERRMKELK